MIAAATIQRSRPVFSPHISEYALCLADFARMVDRALKVISSRRLREIGPKTKFPNASLLVAYHRIGLPHCMPK
jgi:hypothetical protein